jgi:DnaJ-class molecular chaperone
VQIVVTPHRHFTREGADILLDLPITVKEAALGAEVRTPTPTGSVMLKIPKRSNTGDVLRLRGKGVKTRGASGDERVKLKVMMPTDAEPELDAFLADWTPAGAYDPRKEM